MVSGSPWTETKFTKWSLSLKRLRITARQQSYKNRPLPTVLALPVEQVTQGQKDDISFFLTSDNPSPEFITVNITSSWTAAAKGLVSSDILYYLMHVGKLTTARASGLTLLCVYSCFDYATGWWLSTSGTMGSNDDLTWQVNKTLAECNRFVTYHSLIIRWLEILNNIIIIINIFVFNF